jgi:hypothetical protein
MPTTNIICNDNQAFIQRSKYSTTKGLCHIQVQENCVRGNVVSHFVTKQHVDGKKSCRYFLERNETNFSFYGST